jgi:dipeptidyl-peptidase-4
MIQHRANTAWYLFFALVLLVSGSAVAGEKPVDWKGMSLDIDGLYRTPSLIGTKPTHVVWSPDSSRVAFAWNDEGRAFKDVWTWSPGTEQAIRLTHFGEHDKGVSDLAWADTESVVYVLGDSLMRREIGSVQAIELASGERPRNLAPSPDSQQLAYVTNEGLHLLELGIKKTEPVLVLAHDDPAVRLASLQWSKNGTRLAFMQIDSRPLPQREIHYQTREGQQVMTVRRAFPGDETALYKVGVLDAPSGVVRFLKRPDERDYVWNFGISSDGSKLFLNGSDLLIKHHRIDVYDLDSGEREVFYQEHDPLHLRPDWRAAWAPDDKGLLILTDRDGYLHLYHQADATAEPRALTSGQWEISSFRADKTGEWAYFLANRSHLADKTLYRVPFAGGDIERVTDGHGTHQPVFSPDMHHAISLFSDDQTPHDLYHLDLGSLETTKITRSPQPGFHEQHWAEVRYVEFPSRLDGVELVGRLSLPPDYDSSQTYPLIVGSIYSDSVLNQWGGRQSHPTWGLDQYLVAQGYILLNVNIRGSWGQGREHNQGQRFGYGVVDIEDLHSGVEYLVREGFADSRRVGIWGSSYGGLMTTMSLFKKPGIYAVGIAGAPATNVAHAYPGQMWVMGTPVGDDQPYRYQNQSPLYHSAGLEDPLMIIHGTKDQVVLYSDTIAVVQNLIEQEKSYDLVSLPGVGHGWDNEAPEVRRFAFRKMVEFFNRYLQP